MIAHLTNHIANSFILTPRQDTDGLPADIGTLLEPEAIAFSFDTVGWKVLGLLLITIMLFFIIKWAIKYHKNAYRRAALSILDQINAQFTNDKEAAGLNDTLILLKQVAITTFGRAKIADLRGSDWLKFLESKGKNTPFMKYEVTISNCLYTNKTVDVAASLEIIALSKRWIITHA